MKNQCQESLIQYLTDGDYLMGCHSSIKRPPSNEYLKILGGRLTDYATSGLDRLKIRVYLLLPSTDLSPDSHEPFNSGYSGCCGLPIVRVHSDRESV